VGDWKRHAESEGFLHGVLPSASFSQELGMHGELPQEIEGVDVRHETPLYSSHYENAKPAPGTRREFVMMRAEDRSATDHSVGKHNRNNRSVCERAWRQPPAARNPLRPVSSGTQKSKCV
jgi:hypothetical protein